MSQQWADEGLKLSAVQQGAKGRGASVYLAVSCSCSSLEQLEGPVLLLQC